MKKKILITLLLTVCMIAIMPKNIAMATEKRAHSGESSSSTTSGEITEDNWIEKAFSATSTFLTKETTVEDKLGVFDLFKKIVRAINRVLLVALFGLSTISLSVIGVRYMLSGARPEQKKTAVDSLHTLFMGMAYGFGAFIIWNISMSIVGFIINAIGS